MEKSREVDMVRLSLLSEPRRRKVKFEDQRMQKAEAEQNSQPQTHRPISDRIMARVFIHKCLAFWSNLLAPKFGTWNDNLGKSWQNRS